MTGKSHKGPKRATANENPAESLDAVRDLLFGATAQQFGNSVAALEKKLGDEIAYTQRQSQRALEELRIQHEAQLRVAREQAKNENESQTDSVLELEAKVDGLFNSLGNDLTAIASRLANTETGLRSLVDQSVANLRDELQQGLNRLEQRLDGEIAMRHAESVSRADFIDIMQSAIERVSLEPIPTKLKAKAS